MVQKFLPMWPMARFGLLAKDNFFNCDNILLIKIKLVKKYKKPTRNKLGTCNLLAKAWLKKEFLL